MKPLTRFIPQGYVKYTPEIGDYPRDLFAAYINIEKLTAIFFIAKQSRPTWHYRFKNIEKMKETINESIKRVMFWQEKKEERRILKAKTINDQLSNLKIGDLFSNSWGYDQTNVDFYQVTEIKGKTFTIREIGNETVPGSGIANGMAARVKAVKNNFLTDREPIVKRSFSMKFGCLTTTTENQEHYCSWYA